MPDLLLVVNSLHREEISHRRFFSLGGLLLVALNRVIIKYRKNFSPTHKYALTESFFFFEGCKRIKNKS
jgi:hypothetical protein